MNKKNSMKEQSQKNITGKRASHRIDSLKTWANTH